MSPASILGAGHPDLCGFVEVEFLHDALKDGIRALQNAAKYSEEWSISISFKRKTTPKMSPNQLKRATLALVHSALYAWFLLFVGGLHAQNIESIGPSVGNLSSQGLGLNGGVNLSSNFYSATSIDPRRDNLQWLAHIHLNLSFGPVDAPFSFAFSDGNQQFNLPSYSFTGISPTYKWATLHAGDRSMHFSKYTLSALNFRGAGVELEPGRFRFKAMYGRLTKAVAEDLNARQSLDAAYERVGYSVMAGYEIDGFNVHAIVFGAEDDENSIADPINSDITPADNVVASLKARKALSNKFILDAEFARSGFNTDSRTSENTEFFDEPGNKLLGLFTPTETATFGNALNAGLTFNQLKYTVRLGYEKIDRGFKTLGALFFNSDLEHYTGSISTRLFRNKVSLALRAGLEQTNKEDLGKPENERVVASINATYNPGRFIFSASFSNFDNSTKIRAREDPSVFVDSLFLAQLSQTYTFTGTYKISEQYNPTTLTAVLSHQSASSIQDDIVLDNAESKFNNAALIFNQRLTESEINWTASLNYNKSTFGEIATNTFSPTAMITKPFFQKKLNSTLRLTYNTVMIEGGNNSNVLNLSWTNSWNIVKNQALGFSLTYTNRSGSGGEGLGDFSELYGRINYNYQFASALGGANRNTQQQ